MRKNTRNLILVSSCIVALCLLVSVVILPVMGQNRPKPAQEASSTAPVSSYAEPEYIVKKYNNGIAVFQEGTEKPFRYTEIDLRALPEADQHQLEEGIHVTGKAALNRLLQDYCS